MNEKIDKKIVNMSLAKIFFKIFFYLNIELIVEKALSFIFENLRMEILLEMLKTKTTKTHLPRMQRYKQSNL